MRKLAKISSLYYLIALVLLLITIVSMLSSHSLEKTLEENNKRFVDSFCGEFIKFFGERMVYHTEVDTVTDKELEARWCDLTRASAIWSAKPSKFLDDSEKIDFELNRLEYDFRDAWWELENKGALSEERYGLLVKIKAALPALVDAVYDEDGVRPECYAGTYLTDKFMAFFIEVYGNGWGSPAPA